MLPVQIAMMREHFDLHIIAYNHTALQAVTEVHSTKHMSSVTIVGVRLTFRLSGMVQVTLELCWAREQEGGNQQHCYSQGGTVEDVVVASSAIGPSRAVLLPLIPNSYTSFIVGSL